MNMQSPHLAGNASPSAARAGGSSFYFAMRILGREQREAMFEIYSFCRAVDDIADGERAARTAHGGARRLAARHRCALCRRRCPPGSKRLRAVIGRFGLRKEDFLAVIDGMEMDAKADIRAPSMDELDLYCDRVASAVGRLSVRVFGMGEDDGRALAHHLGRALQLTNILRDLDEDAERRPALFAARGAARRRHREQRSVYRAESRAARRRLPLCRRAGACALHRGEQDHGALPTPCGQERRASWARFTAKFLPT